MPPIAAGAAVEGRRGAGAAWALSNHDFGRFPTRFGRANERAAALMLMTLPGTATLYQGDEIGQGMGAGRRSTVRPHRPGRVPSTRCSGTARGGGLQRGGAVAAPHRSGRAQRRRPARRPGSLLSFWRELIALRRDLTPGFRMIESDPGVISYERGDKRGRGQRGRRAGGCPAGRSGACDVARCVRSARKLAARRRRLCSTR